MAWSCCIILKKMHFSCLLAHTHHLCYLHDVSMSKPLVSSTQGMIPAKSNLSDVQIEYVALNAMLEYKYWCVLHCQGLFIVCLSLPIFWFVVLHLMRKLFTSLLFAISQGWQLMNEGWHWMLSEITAIGVFASRLIDLLAVGICCTLELVS